VDIAPLFVQTLKSGGAGGTRTPNPFQGSRFQGGVFIQPGLLHGPELYFTFFRREFNCRTPNMTIDARKPKDVSNEQKLSIERNIDGWID
jgi:hypothetical protein